ncbi:MAG: CoB--CoM heterodisulfide reductase iron-sulfur subunit B family protein [Anaerolineae bacterium]|nr:CoB--CoM heterodisulfide reductase iron-sulfur subunit B family protein [Anaerolineae bacterium]
MRYLLYPGCSAEGSALEYLKSTLAVMRVLDVELQELDDWTCCGASVAPVMSELLGLVLPARNLALAERDGAGLDVLTICSACYTNFRRTDAAAAKPATLKKINQALEVEGLTYRGKARARHLLDVLANDIGADAIAARVRRPLTGLTVAPYYGCQTVRPYSPFDDDERPTSMNAILEALGVAVHHHARQAYCCGTSLMVTKPEVAQPMVGAILEACSPADCIVTVCPMCHMNLDSYQEAASRAVGGPFRVPVLFLPQLLGLAFGLPQAEMMFHRHVVPVAPALARLVQPEVQTA